MPGPQPVSKAKKKTSKGLKKSNPLARFAKMSDKKLRSEVRKLVVGSPTLGHRVEQKKAVLALIPRVGRRELKGLLKHLLKERVNWKEYIESHTKAEEKLFTTFQGKLKAAKREDDRLTRTFDEHGERKGEEEAADTLLHNL
jgi:hypothetical protein